MNRINEKGLQMIQYKTELSKDYPKIVRDSLLIALEQMIENKIIDLNTLQILQDSSVSKESFEEYLLENANFSKTREELHKEFEVVRLKLDELLPSFEIEDLMSESDLDKDVITLGEKFFIGEAFVMAYFGIDDKEVNKLMKRKGFVETFAVLRLTAIFNDILKQLPVVSTYKIDSSLVYFDSEGEGYNIDLIFEIPVDSIHFENEDEINALLSSIKEAKSSATRIYQRKMEI